MTLLKIESLVVGYDAFPVLHGVDFEVQEGEVCVLLGLNGAGKTTTVSTIAGLLRPRSGRVLFDGKDLGRKSPSARVSAGISLCPEGRRVFPRLTVRQNLRLGAWTRRRDSKTVKRQLDLAYDYFPRLAEREEQLAGTLSGGEQQMLAVGRALMSRPRLLLIDEASLGLSPTVAKTVWEVTSRIKADGTTVLMVEQNAGALPFADRALIMEKGTLVYTGVGDELRQVNLREAYLGA
ncbi:amino acid/amide ABC transporter ATP-binding protein 2, HAAT family [Actinokineospora alba]|uniref:Amino acid/amide ABC transporter ATP-binding protein 2, HAAT family n=1 Tax=Actinokineospora alba TaxID=504798 RepID=A0A1H0JZY3_9PSEU|nr:ABC transporter ATP-binding protein [Actinokineospora alba]TDP68095.1 amino acid/amide ABC transporter ATP-binding protein 2 (HAAT family) [Actinokineospora alba]SDH92226.1 branched-chain amino acid transport system ATP-binding protein [Actinokineospora alba]SDO49348.1 amino acid/amide ABC transporter ATP-binding protein 2, HAAT family [Actinokineospora alba]